MWMCARCQSINEDSQEVCPRCRAAKEAQQSPVVRPSAVAPQFSQPFEPSSGAGPGVTPASGSAPGSPTVQGMPEPPPYASPQTFTDPPVSFGSAPGAAPGYAEEPNVAAYQPAPVAPSYSQPLQTGSSEPVQSGYVSPVQVGYAAPPAYGSPSPSSSGAAEVAAVAALGIGALLLRLLHPVRLILIAIGIACIFGGNYLAHRRTSFMAHAVRTPGTVTALKEQSSGDSTMYYPVVTFRTRDGLPVTMTSSSGSRPPEFHVGETCAIYYNPLSPTDAVIDSTSSKLIPWFLWIFGGIMILAALFGRQTAS